MPNLNNMTPREFLMAHGVRISSMRRDGARMTNDAFRQKYGISVRDARAKMRRLAAISADPEKRPEAAELVRLLTSTFARFAAVKTPRPRAMHRADSGPQQTVGDPIRVGKPKGGAE